MSTVIKVAGLDPSLSNLGICYADLVYENGVWRPVITELILQQTKPGKIKQVRKNSDDVERARELVHAIRGVEEVASIVFAEVPFGSQSARAMASYGVSVALMAMIDRPLVQVDPNSVKMVATGTNTATKNQMIDAAMSEAPTAPWLLRSGRPVLKNEHLADAYFTIKAGLKTDQFKGMAAMMQQRPVAG